MRRKYSDGYLHLEPAPLKDSDKPLGNLQPNQMRKYVQDQNSLLFVTCSYFSYLMKGLCYHHWENFTSNMAIVLWGKFTSIYRIWKILKILKHWDTVLCLQAQVSALQSES